MWSVASVQQDEISWMSRKASGLQNKAAVFSQGSPYGGPDGLA